MLPEESTATPHGLCNTAAVAGPPSPEKLSVHKHGAFWPFPATVVIVPPDTFRMRSFPVSAMYTFPRESTATPSGLLRAAFDASAPSPEKPQFPLPAKVLIVPLVASLRDRKSTRL